jgi:hypothetical protein
MTETQYQAVLYAERIFGRIQVRSHTRKLAVDLGLPADCMEAPAGRPWPRMVAQIRAAHRIGFGIMPPDAYVNVTAVTVA